MVTIYLNSNYLKIIMKHYILILFSLLLMMGCSKDGYKDPVTKQISILVKNSSSTGKWKLSSLKKGTVPQVLTATQLAYVKSYTADFKFSDTDGLKGTWVMPTTDSLMAVFTNFSSGVSVKQSYKINSISDTQLNLNYTVNGEEINAIYTATN